MQKRQQYHLSILSTYPMSIRYFIIFLVLWTIVTPANAQGKAREITLSVAQKRKLNTFFSNFSEVGQAPFKKGQLSEATMIHFGVWHRKQNNYEYFSPASGKNYEQRIHVRHIESAALWYFGKKITRHRSVPGARYQESYYYITTGDGDPLLFAQISKLYDNGDGTFTAYTNEYSTNEADVHGTAAQWKKADHEVGNEGKRKALIKRVGSGAGQRYILLEYLKV